MYGPRFCGIDIEVPPDLFSPTFEARHCFVFRNAQEQVTIGLYLRPAYYAPHGTQVMDFIHQLCRLPSADFSVSPHPHISWEQLCSILRPWPPILTHRPVTMVSGRFRRILRALFSFHTKLQSSTTKYEYPCTHVTPCTDRSMLDPANMCPLHIISPTALLIDSRDLLSRKDQNHS